MTKSKLANPIHLPVFDHSAIFLLEILGEGGFGMVHKAYDKKRNEFVAVKKFKKILEENKESKETLEQIILEDELLNNVEKIRARDSNCNEYFLKYDGVFKDETDESSMILKMESGCATLENILEAGKVFSCAELLYVQRKMLEGFAILEENGIANRDVKTQNIILVEDPTTDGKYFYKISDFGIGCVLLNNACFVPADSLNGFTKKYAAPEVIKLFEQISMQNKKKDYNPFLADVYSFGLLSLKMINKSWGKKELKKGLLSMKEKFKDYEPILEILKRMLEEDPIRRWNFKKILKFYEDNVDRSIVPSDEVHYCHKWQSEFKEKSNEKTMENLEQLYEEHLNFYFIYEGKVTRPKEARFHVDRAWEIIEKMKKINEKNLMENNNEKDYSWWLFKKTIFCWTRLGENALKMRNFELAEEYFKKCRASIYERKHQLKCKETENTKNDEDEMENSVLICFGTLYMGRGDYSKAEEFFFKSLEISRNLYGENHVAVASILTNIAGLYVAKCDLPKAEEFYLRSIKIDLTLFGENNQSLATSLSNLGSLYFAMENLSKGEELQKKSVKILQNLFGDNNSMVAMSLNTLGKFYFQFGKFQMAEAFFIKALKIYRNLWGENHFDVEKSYKI